MALSGVIGVAVGMATVTHTFSVVWFSAESGRKPARCEGALVSGERTRRFFSLTLGVGTYVSSSDRA